MAWKRVTVDSHGAPRMCILAGWGMLLIFGSNHPTGHKTAPNGPTIGDEERWKAMGLRGWASSPEGNAANLGSNQPREWC
jgi:hypothetical protein